jgi:oligoendopeptidase F
MIAKTRRLPARSQVKPADTWDLSSLFGDDAAWETVFTEWEQRIGGYEAFRGKLSDSPEALAACLRFDTDFEYEGERLGTYAFLKTAEDTANSTYQRMTGRYRNVASRAAQAASYIRPEIMAIPAKSMARFLEAAVLSEFRVLLEQLLRYKPHTLGNNEEKLLAMQSEMAEASNQIFRQLTDADLKWGSVRNEDGELVELSHATFSALLQSPDRNVRRKAFQQYYSQFAAHENTLAATLAGSVQRDVYYARARAYPSALTASLFHDKVPVSVVDNLIASVHRHLPALYRYYDLRRRKMRLREIHHYDTYVPILSELKTRHTWNDAVKLVISAIEPLGDEYCAALELPTLV